MRIRALAAVLIVTVSPALADDPPFTLPDMVVTATRVPTPLKDIPAGVTVIDRETIEQHGYNTLTDALADVPGLHVSQSGGPGQQASVFVRGSDSNHVLVLRDGMPINDASDPSAAFDFGIDTLSDIERIEIIRGPMAALYGSGAIGGVINLLSRRGQESGIHWIGDIAGGYPATIRGSVNASGIEGPVDFSLTAESQSQAGYDLVPQREAAYNGASQGFRDRTLTLNLGYTPVEGTRLSLLLRANISYFGYVPDDPVYNDTNASAQAASLLGRIGGTTHLFDDALESSAYVGQLQDDRRFLQPLEAANPYMTTSDSRYHSYRTDVQWNNTLHLDNLLPVSGLSASALTFGYENIGDQAKVRTNSDSGGFVYAQNASAQMTTNAIYLGLQTTVLERLALTGQLRQDWVDSDAATTWRFGGVYDLREISTRLKLSYGTGFRAPSLYDRYGVDSFGYVGNPALKPEYATGWEAGFTTDLPAAGRIDFATVGATYFDQRIRDLIVGVYAPVDTEVNLDAAHVHGVETEVTLRPARWLDLHAAYTLLNTTSDGVEAAAEGSQLLRRPQNQASVDMTIRPLPGLRIVGTLIYTGPAHDYLYDNNGNGIGYSIGQHGLIANTAITYTVLPQLDLYVNASNIFNSKFEPVNGYQAPGPTVLAGARIRL